MAPSLNWLWPWSRTPESPSQSQPQSHPQSDPQPTPHTQPKEQRLQPPETPNLAPPLPNNLKLLLGGLIFLPLSLMLTRRALHKRFVSAIPAYYTSATNHRPQVSGAMDALEAFNLATLNVGSVAMLVSGAVTWKLGVNSVDDLRGVVRQVTRGQVAVESGGEDSGVDGENGNGNGKERPRTDDEIESELQEWVASVLAKQFKEKTKKEVERRRKERGDVGEES